MSHRLPEALNYLHILQRKKCQDITHQFHASVNGFFHVVKRVTLSLSISVPQSQHSITGGSNTVSLSFSLSHSLTAISCTSEHLHFSSSTAQFHLCLLPVDYCGTVARWLRSCRSANVTTSVRPSIGEIVASLSLFQRKDWRRRRKTERGGGMEGKGRSGEGLARAQLGQGI